jgi:hypothetical protein
MYDPNGALQDTNVTIHDATVARLTVMLTCWQANAAMHNTNAASHDTTATSHDTNAASHNTTATSHDTTAIAPGAARASRAD